MTAALAVLEQRAEDLRDRLNRDRHDLVSFERRELRLAQETLREQQTVATRKREAIEEKETELREINAALHALRGTRAISDSPQA